MTLSSKQNHEALIIYNPVAGTANAKVLKRLIENRFHSAGWVTHFHKTVKDENLTKVIQPYIKRQIDLVVVAGGDGTVAAVAAGLIHSSIPLGIIPTGTWNAIARHLRISFNPVRAIATMTGKHKTQFLDLMSIGETLHAMNLGVGFSSSIISNTSRDQKRQLGNLAYYSQIINQIFGLQLKKYVIEADGKKYRGLASEILVANYGVVGLNMLESALNIHPDDGKVDVLIIRARTMLDLPIMFWQALVQRKKRVPKYHQLSASRIISIQTTPPLAVQADGELFGKTPVTITVVPRCVRVIVPN